MDVISTITFEWEITINIHITCNNQVILHVTSHYINIVVIYLCLVDIEAILEVI